MHENDAWLDPKEMLEGIWFVLLQEFEVLLALCSLLLDIYFTRMKDFPLFSKVQGNKSN